MSAASSWYTQYIRGHWQSTCPWSHSSKISAGVLGVGCRHTSSRARLSLYQAFLSSPWSAAAVHCRLPWSMWTQPTPASPAAIQVRHTEDAPALHPKQPHCPPSHPPASTSAATQAASHWLALMCILEAFRHEHSDVANKHVLVLMACRAQAKPRQEPQTTSTRCQPRRSLCRLAKGLRSQPRHSWQQLPQPPARPLKHKRHWQRC